MGILAYYSARISLETATRTEHPATASQVEQDIVHSYNLDANAHVTKPVDLAQNLVIDDFWLEIVKLPNS